MATWQYEFLLLPSAKAKLLGLLPGMQFLDFEQIDIWKDHQLPDDFKSRISSLLPKSQSWSNQIELWGSESGNRVQIVIEADIVTEISVRLDLRINSKDFLKSILDIARSYGCLILGENCYLIEPSFEAVLKDVEISSAFKFVKSPDSFLGNS